MHQNVQPLTIRKSKKSWLRHQFLFFSHLRAVAFVHFRGFKLVYFVNQFQQKIMTVSFVIIIIIYYACCCDTCKQRQRACWLLGVLSSRPFIWGFLKARENAVILGGKDDEKERWRSYFFFYLIYFYFLLFTYVLHIILYDFWCVYSVVVVRKLK